MDPVMIEVERCGLVESVHHARVVVTGAGGGILYQQGDVAAPTYPRSSLKPFQAVGMLRAGLDLDGAKLALAAASHSGEEFHRRGAEEILAGAGLDVTHLQNTPDQPIDDAARVAWVRAGRGPESVAQNCSGKHAAMLRTTMRIGADPAHYREPTHPVQVVCHDGIADFVAEIPGHLGVDGCGAPLWSTSLVGLARGFGRLAAAKDGPEFLVSQAFREFPQWASGTTRDEVRFHRGVPGLVCKVGAEGVFAAGLEDGRGIAVKVMDGSARGRAALVAEILTQLGVADESVRELRTESVLGHGQPVGQTRVVNLQLAS